MARKAIPAIAEPDARPRWAHQDRTLEFLDRTKRGMDNSDPGTGKTRAQVEFYAQRPSSRRRMLVLCPKTLMRSAWGTDIEKFAPRLTTSYAYAEQRTDAFDAGTDVVVMNIDGVKWLAEKANRKRLFDFDHLVIDEYTSYKHATSQRSKAIHALRRQFEYRYGLSGTPNPNTVMELWHPTLLLDDGKRLGMSYHRMRNIMQTPTQIGPSPDHLRWDDRPGATQAVEELLSDITIRHAFEDVMTHVPANHKDVKTFTLSRKAKTIYDRMENECMVAFDQAVVSAVHAASLRTKLLQIASGAVYDGSAEGSYQLVDTQRYELITELVEERAHSIVFFNWRHQRDCLAKAFEKAGISYALIDGTVPNRQRDVIVEAYQAGKYRTLLLHPRTGAHGLTLTRGTTTIVASPIYEADLLKQAIHRIYRGDQDQVTNTILVQAIGTVEDIVYARLEERYGRMTDLLQQMAHRSKRA